MTTIEFDKSIRKIVIKSDEITTKALLEYRRKQTRFCTWLKSWREEEVLDRLYDNPRRIGPKNGIWTFEVGVGWAAFIAQVFKNKISLESYQNLISCIYSSSYRTMPFPELRPYQSEDLLHMLKYRFGLASLNTGYGKTHCICVLAHYFYAELGMPTLLVCPGVKAREELVKRYKMLYDESLPTNWEGDFGCVITAGVLQKNSIRDKNKAKIEAQKLLKFRVCISDETEYTVNDGGKWIYDRLLNVEHMYGFSGSADRFAGECISFINGITGTVMDNKDVVKYFGPSLVHRQPVSNKVNIIAVKTPSFDFLEFGENEINEDDNVYMSIMNSMWTNPMVIESIEKVIKAYPKLYIPINNLETVINTWVDYWKGKFRILVICGQGYIYYDARGNMTNLSLEEAADLIAKDLVDVIPSTSSGFRALDFKNLSNMLMVAGKAAGIVLQTVGRTARMQEMNLIHLEPKGHRWIPIYTKGTKHRIDMIKEYYKYSEIRDITLNIEDLVEKI